MEKDDSVDRPSSSTVNSESLRILRLKSRERMEGENRLVYEFIPIVENWVESTGSRWSSSGTFSNDSQRCRFSPRSRT